MRVKLSAGILLEFTNLRMLIQFGYKDCIFPNTHYKHSTYYTQLYIKVLVTINFLTNKSGIVFIASLTCYMDLFYHTG